MPLIQIEDISGSFTTSETIRSSSPNRDHAAMVIPPQPKSVATAPEPLQLPAADESSDDDDWLSKTCSVFAKDRTHETKVAPVEITPAKRKSAALALPTYETKQAPVEDPPGRKLTAVAERKGKRNRVTIDVSSKAENHRNAVPREIPSSVIDLASESGSECDNFSSSQAMIGKTLANGTGKAPVDAKVEEIVIDDSEDDDNEESLSVQENPKLLGKKTLPDPIVVKSDPGEIQVKGRHSNEITIDDGENEDDDLLTGTGSVLGKKKTIDPNPKLSVNSENDDWIRVGQQKYPVGTKIYKSFLNNRGSTREYSGEVVGYNQGTQLYYIEYEDDDEEDMTEEEVQEHLGRTGDQEASEQGSVEKEIESNAFEAKPIPEKIKSGRLLHLEGIAEDIDRALQLLLWEVGFGYNVYAHQFEAIRFVAGLVPTYPVPSNAKKGQRTFDEVATSLAAYDTEGSNCRSTALEMAAIEFDSRLNSDDNTTVRYTHTLPTKGMLLADEMGLGECLC